MPDVEEDGETSARLDALMDTIVERVTAGVVRQLRGEALVAGGGGDE